MDEETKHVHTILINDLYVRQTLVERMVTELYANFAQTRPDTSEVLDRLLDRLTVDVNSNFSEPHMSDVHRLGMQFIERLRDAFATRIIARNA